MFAWLSTKTMRALIALLAVGWGASAALAQVGSGTLVGTVRDASNQKPVPDVVVTVTSPALQGEEIAVTGSGGDFRISGLPPGEYTVRMDKESYRPYSRSGIRVRADVTLRVDTQILPEGLKTDIVVVARAPTVDVGSTQTGSTIDKEFQRRVPNIRPGGKGSETRSIEAAAATAPQAKADGYGTSIAGTTSPENNYVVDGLSVGDPAYGTLGTPLTMEFVEELSIITGGYLPEYGKSTGGVINAITKSGSDEFELSLWGFFSPGALQGERTKIRTEAQTIDVQAGDVNIYDFGFAIGGPIMKEKLWFYLGADFAVVNRNYTRSLRRIAGYDAEGNPNVDSDGFTITEELPGTSKDYLAEARTLQLFGKLTYRLNKSNRLSLTLLAGPRWSGGDGDFAIDERSGGSLTSLGGDPSRVSVVDGMTFDGMLEWNADLIDNKLLLETSIGYHLQTNATTPEDGSKVGSKTGQASLNGVAWRRTPNAAGTRTYHDIRDFEDIPDASLCDTPEGATDIRCPVITYVSGGLGYMDDYSLTRVGARSVLTWLPEAAGTHVIKFGAELDYLGYDLKKGYGGGIYYRESTSGATFSDYRAYGFLSGPDEEVPMDVSGSDTYSTSLGVFLQDSWTFTKGLTANIGVRWDAQWMQNHDGDTVIALANQWAPRLGLVWDPTGDGGAKIFANLALFYESIPLDLLDRAGSGDPTLISIKAKAACDPSDPEQAKTTCLDDDSRISLRGVYYGDESPDGLWYAYGAGRTAVDPDLEAQSSWEFVGGAEYDLGRVSNLLKDVRVGALYTKRWMNNVIEDMSRDEAQTYFIGNPGSGIAKDFAEAKRDYDALTLYFMKEFSDCWLLQGSYTLSWLEGNYAGLFRPETGQLDPNINSDFDLKSLTVNRDGYLPGDSRHQFKLYGAHDIELAKGHHLQPGYGWRLVSGGPTNYLGSHPLYGGDEVFVLPRGEGDRLPWVTSIDLTLGYELQVSESFKLNFTVEVFNVFNFQAPGSKDETYTFSDVDPIRNGGKGDLEGMTDLYGDPVEVNPNFGKTTSYQAPRTFRFGIRGTL